MSEKHENPYRATGAYHKVFAVAKAKQVVTAAMLIAAGVKLGKTEDAAKATADVLLSPTKDNQGNLSARGDLYYFERLPQKTVKSEKEEQKYRLRWREKALERRVRGEHVASEKSSAPAEKPDAVTA